MEYHSPEEDDQHTPDQERAQEHLADAQDASNESTLGVLNAEKEVIEANIDSEEQRQEEQEDEE
ncbi:MAG: hypothetical protein V4478_01345 [Patescibacteria group bacterium]